MVLKSKKSAIALTILGCLSTGVVQAHENASLPLATSQQDENVCAGTIIDGTFNEPLMGASVMVKGTSAGSVTDMDGKFSIPKVKKGAILQISFVGYKTIEVRWDGQPLTVTLKEDADVLQEVVVTAYGGKQLRTKLTNSISKVEGESLTAGVHSNPAQALSGAVSGLQVRQTSGNPGSVPTMVLRGGTNLDGSGSPLIVVDGQVRADLSDINPEDIESLEVMKDAGATAIYGARANNGVVLITTKRGKEGFSEIRFKAKLSVNHYVDNYNYLNAGDYLHYIRKAIQNASQCVTLSDGTKTGWTNMNSLTQAQPYGTGNIYFNSDGTVADGNKVSNANWGVMKYEDKYASLLNQGWNTMTDPVYGDKLIYYDFSLKDTNIDDNALSQDYNVSLTGGNDKGNYYLNVGYNDSKGNAVGNEYKRFNFLFNADYKIRKWLTSNTSISFTNTKWYDIYDGKSGDGITNTMNLAYFFSRAFSLPPTFRGYNADGEYLYGVRGDLSDQIYLINKDNYDRDNNTKKYNFNENLVFDIMKGLTLKLGATLYIFDTNKEYFNHDIIVNRTSTLTNRKSYAYNDRQVDQTYNALLNYDNQITDDHYVSAMLGFEYYDSYDKGFSAMGYGAATDEFKDLELTQTDGRDINSWHNRQRIMSFFGRVNYDYQSKYLLSVVMRRDGYSKLLGDNRWGVFPGVSTGWVMSKEAFMEPVKDILSYTKMRLSYGLNGNVSGIGYYDLQGRYGNAAYGGSVGKLYSSISNPGLKWEKSHTFEFGFDFGFLNNKYLLNMTYYNRRTKDKFASIPVPSHSGISSWTTNNGEIENQGLEFDVTAKIINTKDWKFSFTGNLAWNKNKIISLPYNGLENNRQGASQVYSGNGNELIWVGGYQEGQTPGDIYGFLAEGIYEKDSDVPGNLKDISTGNNGARAVTLLGPDAYAALSDADKKNTSKYLPIQAGDVKWKDVNGDGVIDNYDMVKLGNSMPKVTGGFTLSLSWKDLTLSSRMDYALGHTVVDNKTPWIMGCMQGSYNTIDLTKDTWSPENTNATYPTYVWADQYGKRNYARYNNSLFVYKGDYLAFREVTLAYKLPKSLISKILLQSAELSFTAQNLGYWTAAKNIYSPEYGADSNGGYSLPRSFVFGINVSF